MEKEKKGKETKSDNEKVYKELVAAIDAHDYKGVMRAARKLNANTDNMLGQIDIDTNRLAHLVAIIVEQTMLKIEKNNDKLFTAIEEGNITGIKNALKAGAEVDTPISMQSSLYKAYAEAFPNDPISKLTPLDLAVLKRNNKAIKLLIANGAHIGKTYFCRQDPAITRFLEYVQDEINESKEKRMQRHEKEASNGIEALKEMKRYEK